ncbi:S10 family peptidase [Gallaecimonas xiamenensis]|uniref:S10 family peptidase n=1 Tax=Gallaecimonas xiamenensis TaxID=1207039 RepID=UPI001ED99847|nr:peptidase S10 [Gallaecimonas xiamenensis]
MRTLLLGMALVMAPALAADKAPAPAVNDQKVVTEHSLRIHGNKLDYKATTGTLVLKNDKGEPTASYFYVAYTKDDVSDVRKRPVTFAFNGGPGSSSVWLHLGTFGPRRIQFPDVTQPANAPFDLVDNDDSILDATDLVFIDPVGTGYSKAEGKAEGKDFWGVKADKVAMADFIRLWLTRAERWNSPKFLAGESYGTTRSAAVVDELENRGVYMNGVMLISSILNFQTARFETGNDLPYITFLPTYAATAWYHNALPNKPQDLEAFLQEVRDFAGGQYASALMQGSKLPTAQKAQIIDKLHQYTGLDKAYLDQTNLRISIFRFTKELLRDQRRTVGRLDSRFIGIDRDAAGESFQHDPSYTAIMGPYTAAFNDYVRRELKFKDDSEYQILSGKVNRAWDWDTDRAGYTNVAEDLRHAMSTNTHLKVMVANGYYDLATPFYATEYTFSHMDLEPSIEKNVSFSYYPAGHMMYVQPDSRIKLNQTVRDFIKSAY